MAKVRVAVGFTEGPVEKQAGVWVEQIVEKNYYGDVLRNTRLLRGSDETPNSDLALNNSVSILADPYANEHYFAMRFVVLSGVPWIVDEVEVQGRRLNLRLGGVYNGERAPLPSDAPGTPSAGSGDGTGV